MIPKLNELIALLSNMPYFLDLFLFGLAGIISAFMFWFPVTSSLFNNKD